MGITSKSYEGIEDGSLGLIAGKRHEADRRDIRLFQGQPEQLTRPGTVVDVTQPLSAIEFITLSARCLNKPVETLLQLIRRSGLHAGRIDWATFALRQYGLVNLHRLLRSSTPADETQAALARCTASS